MDNLCIVIPAYNEEKRIGDTLEEYGKFFSKLKNKRRINTELLVVINNTQDNTEGIVKMKRKKFSFIRYLNFKQGGKGFAIIEGFKEALKNKKNNLIGFVDADMATSPEAFYDLIKNISNSDGIIASRYSPGAKVSPKQTLRRIFVSRVFNLLIRILFLMPYRDTQCGAKILKRQALNSVLNRLGITQWAFDVDLLYHLRKQKLVIREYPTTWADKEYSKINFINAGPKMALSVIRLRIVNSRFGWLVKK